MNKLELLKKVDALEKKVKETGKTTIIKWSPDYWTNYYKGSESMYFSIKFEAANDTPLDSKARKVCNALRLSFLKKIAALNDIELSCGWRQNKDGFKYRQNGFKVDDYYTKQSRELLEAVVEKMGDIYNHDCKYITANMYDYITVRGDKTLDIKAYNKLREDYFNSAVAVKKQLIDLKKQLKAEPKKAEPKKVESKKAESKKVTIDDIKF